MKIQAFHGTNQDFETFSRAKLGLNNPNTASEAGFFFALRPDTAWDYANQAGRKLLPNQEGHERKIALLLQRADRASLRGDFATYERLTLEAEEMETTALQAPPAGMVVLQCELEVDNALRVSGESHDVVVNLGAVITRARDLGHDAVIIEGIHDTPSGAGEPDTHIVVFEPKAIRIVNRLTAEAPRAERAVEMAM